MKLTAILLLAAALQVSARSEGQTVTLSEKNAPLERVFREIRKQTGYNFLYNDAWLGQTKGVTIQVRNAPLTEVLNICFKDQPFTYSIVERTIVVKKRSTPAVRPGDPFPIVDPPPPIDVKGRVVNENGEPVIASIIVKGTNQGTTSNADGYFELKGVDENATLVISGVGIESFEQKVNGKTNFDLTAKIKVGSLNEVIVNKGYYTTSQRLNTGNVSKVTAEIISKQPVSNPLSALEGRVTGLFITQQTGIPGGNFTIQIRGRNSIAAGNDPLYIIDGVPFTSTSLSSNNITAGITRTGNPLNNFNPSDIESIEVLKDADATSIYGSRGANGVILITTKKGKAGKTKVDVNVYTGVAKVTRTMKLLNTRQYLDMRYEALKNDGITLTSSTPNANDLTNWDTTRYTDWQKLLLGETAHTTDVQASISGGNTNTQFLIGGGYHRETTVFPGDFVDKKLSVHFNLSNTSLNKKFTTVLSSSYVADNNNLLQSDITFYALKLSPNAPRVYDADGKLNWQNSTWNNPFAELLRKYKANTDNLISNVSLSYKILPVLQIKTSLGYTRMTMNEILTQPVSSFDPGWGLSTGYAQFGNSSIKTWIIEPMAEYQKNIGPSWLSVLVGTTLQQNIQEGQVFSANGFTSDALIENIRAAASVSVTSSNYTQYRYNAIFGRINYNWKEKYLLNLTGRRDGSSRFGPGKQFANFGSVGAAWIFSKEKFITNGFPLLNYGKLRVSYGTTGGDQIGDYGYLDTYTPTTYPYQGSVGLYPTRLFNPMYSWEINRKIEAALEIGLVNGRIMFTASYYRNRCSNQLVGYSLPPTTGFSAMLYNLPATVQNMGVELELNATIIKRNDFAWTSAINVTIPRNKLIAYPNFAGSPYVNIYVVGQSLFIKKLFHYSGVDPQIGVYKFEDFNNSGSLSSPSDLQSLKKVSQDYYGGLQNSLQYKGWQLDVFLQFVRQTGFNYLYGGIFSTPGMLGNQPAGVMDRWQKPGDYTNIQKFTQSTSSSAYTSYINNYSLSDNTIGDASFIRLKNLSISYHLPTNLTRRLHLVNSRIYLQGQNLFTITKYQGMDPENNGANRLPPLKVLTVGIQLTF